MTVPPGAVGQLSAAALMDLLPYEHAVEVLEEGLARPAEPGPHRSIVALPEGDLLTMPAYGEEGLGVKLVTVTPANADRGLPLVHATYVLFSPGTMAPELVIDGAALTALRTGAVSALATRHLARPDASRLVVFGAGVQAAAHVEAMQAVRPIDHVTIVGRRAERADALVARLRGQGHAAERGVPEAVRDAHIICTCTPSREPLFAARDVAAGTHINAVGAYRAEMCEIPSELLGEGEVFVEDRAAALAEAGDLLQAIDRGVMEAGDIAADLGEVLRGEAGRRSARVVTVFKSVGLAREDLVVARAAAARLAAAGPAPGAQ